MRPIWPFRHVGLKLVSVGLAVLLWMVVAGEQVVERGLRVPLEFQQVPAGLEVEGELPTLVDVRVRGASGTLSRIGPTDVVAALDLRAARPGRRLFQLTPEEVRVPFGVQVLQVTPASISLVLERSETRDVPVVPSVEGSPAPGYTIGRVTSEPATVQVTGPASAVEKVTEATTETVSVAGATATVSDQVTVGFVDPALRLSNSRHTSIRVEILPGPAERTVRERPIHLRDVGALVQAQAFPPTVEVVLRGTRQSLGRVNVDEVAAFVELGGVGAGDYSMAVRVDAPPDVGVVRISPETVQVKVTNVHR
jgi:YbbR domain-containing protein